MRCHVLFLLGGAWLATTASSFVVGGKSRRHCHPSTTRQSAAAIDFQSDTSRFGRGEQHLSALLDEGDVVVYQTGWWTVDGVVVGDDTKPARFEYCQIETLQVVWTHNCEHGVLRGLTLKKQEDGTLKLVEPMDAIEFGPEQLVARIPVEWKGDQAQPEAALPEDSLWKPVDV